MPQDIPVGLKRTTVLCVLRAPGAFLLLKRSKEPNLGLYVPVGGHIDPYEMPRDAALREVWEETGIRLDAVRFRGVLAETSPTWFNWVNFIYTADVERFDPPSCKEGALEWVEVNRLADIPTPTTDLYIYRLIAQERTFVLNAVYDEQIRLLRMDDEITGEVLFP